jgi:tripartite-type tricarboxylate transporter receptor subunit TctC
METHSRTAGERNAVIAAARAALAALIFGASTAASLAQAPAETFAGKTMQMVIGVSPGGGYDLWGRIVARHLGRHLPGMPSIVPQNMPGAGSMTALNYIYNVAPRDGSVLGIVARDTALAPLQGAEGGRFDATKLSWIGTPALETNVCIGWRGARAQNAQDLTRFEMVLGTVGPGSGSHNYPKALTGLLDMKFKLIPGFPGSADVFLAMERGEVDGFCESLDSVTGKRPDWIKSGKVNVLFQAGVEKHPDLPNAPLVFDLARNPQERTAIEFLYAGQGIGRPFIGPPGISAERLKLLRGAFDAMLVDPDFIAEAASKGLELEPQSGAALEAFVKRIYATPADIVARVSALVR